MDFIDSLKYKPQPLRVKSIVTMHQIVIIFWKFKTMIQMYETHSKKSDWKI